MKPPGIMPTFVKPMDSYRCWAASLEATTALNCRPRKPFLPQVSMQFSTSLRPRPRPREAEATAKLALAMCAQRPMPLGCRMYMPKMMPFTSATMVAV